jgi:UDP-N-acetylmuramoyl-tripeptide--D-alanyl-D-alanine ligase
VEWDLQTRLVGGYNLDNVLGAVAVGRHFGIEPVDINAAITAFAPVTNRSQLVSHEGVDYILDSGSVNPTSLEAALRNFGALEADGKVLVLGSMLRLGESSDQAHREAIALARSIRPDSAVFVGEGYWRVRDRAFGYYFRDTPALRRWWRAGDYLGMTVLVKGASRYHLENVLGLEKLM